MDTKTYKIFEASELARVDWAQFVDVIRWNLDGSKFILEYRTPNPQGLNNSDAWNIMCSNEWTHYNEEL